MLWISASEILSWQNVAYDAVQLGFAVLAFYALLNKQKQELQAKMEFDKKEAALEAAKKFAEQTADLTKKVSFVSKQVGESTQATMGKLDENAKAMDGKLTSYANAREAIGKAEGIRIGENKRELIRQAMDAQAETATAKGVAQGEENVVAREEAAHAAGLAQGQNESSQAEMPKYDPPKGKP